MESKVNELLRETQDLSAELISLKAKFKELEQKNNSELSRMADAFSNLNTQINAVNSLHEVGGRRSPKWYTVEIPFEYGATKAESRTVEVELNPFVCTQLQCSYLITDQDPTHFPYAAPSKALFSNANPAGRSLPCSSYFVTCETMRMQFSAPQYNFNSVLGTGIFLGEVFSSDGTPPTNRGLGWNYPEFDFEISVVGSGRHWTNGHIPAPALFGGSTPLYLGHTGFVDGTDRIEVVAHPTIPTINTQGIVRLVFFGYEIETQESLSDILGY